MMFSAGWMRSALVVTAATALVMPRCALRSHATLRASVEEEIEEIWEEIRIEEMVRAEEDALARGVEYIREEEEEILTPVEPPPKEVPQLPTAEEEEAKLLKVIEGAPKVGVFGCFDSPARTDQFVLDVLHGQKTWGSIVAFAQDTQAAKKKLMGRHARYSGLLDVLEFAASSDDFKSMIDASGVEAMLALNVEPLKVGEYLKAAESAPSCDRVVVVTNGEVPPLPEYNLDWSVITLAADEISDDIPEGGALSLGDEASPAETSVIGRNDAYRIAGEAFLIEPLSKKAVRVYNGGENATAYAKSLRARGFSRRGELAKVMSGELPKWLNNETARINGELIDDFEDDEDDFEKYLPAHEKRLEGESDEEWNNRLWDQKSAKRREKEKKIIEYKTREWLRKDWEKNKYTKSRGITLEAWTAHNWEIGREHIRTWLNFPEDVLDGDDDDIDTGYKPEYYVQKTQHASEDEYEDDDDDDDY